MAALVGSKVSRAPSGLRPSETSGKAHLASRRSAARSRVCAPAMRRRRLRTWVSLGGPFAQAPLSIPKRLRSSRASSHSHARPPRLLLTNRNQPRSGSSSGRASTNFAAVCIATIARCERMREILSSANSRALRSLQSAVSRIARARSSLVAGSSCFVFSGILGVSGKCIQITDEVDRLWTPCGPQMRLRWTWELFKRMGMPEYRGGAQERPNHRARRTAPNCSFSAARDGWWPPERRSISKAEPRAGCRLGYHAIRLRSIR
jgi:hypothetical protein